MTDYQQTKAQLIQLGITLPATTIRKLLSPNYRPPRHLFRLGNTKLSKKILMFSLPAVITCPGRTERCSGGDNPPCYATHYRYRSEIVMRPRVENTVLAHRKDFAELIYEDLRFFQVRVVRPHDSGDFFNVEYANAWLNVMRRTRTSHQYFLFTRSWRVEPIHEVIRKMVRLANVRVWYSVDADSIPPTKLDRRVRLAWMQLDEQDQPNYPVDLVFRNYNLRVNPVKRVSGALVCPYENGVSRNLESTFNCYTCQMCWGPLDGVKDPRHHFQPEKLRGRLSLPMIK